MENLILILCGITGVIFHTLVKAIGLKKQARAGNVAFSFKSYLNDDVLGIVASLCSVVIWWLMFGEAVQNYPKLESWARASFIGMGATGSYILQHLLGNAQKKILSVIDQKTDIADNKTPEL